MTHKSITSKQKWCGLLKPIAFKLLKAFRFAEANRVLKFERNRINPFIYFMESLILAQNERWRRGLGMQVERDSIFSILRKRSFR